MDARRPEIEIEAIDTTVAYGSFEALRIPSLRAKGSVVAIIGHNGSGKSTMIKTLLELLVPREGRLRAYRLGEQRLPLLPENHMAFAPEEGAVFADLAVESYVRLWCRLKQNDADFYRKEGSEYIEKFNLAPLLAKRGKALSKGQRRRVQTAIGFLTKPELFLFDEPFDGLDVQQSSHFARIMHQEADRTSLIISSHRMEVVERLADCVVVLREGEVLTVGSVDEVCEVLCGSCVMVTADNGASESLLTMVPAIEERYAKCLVNRIGSAVSIVGGDIDAAEVSGFLSQHLHNGIHVSQSKPSLVDAMNYHLETIPAQQN